LCAAPAYLERHGRPRVPRDLMEHRCIGIRQGDEAYGLWRLTTGRGSKAHTESIKITGNLATNDGEIAVLWALQGHGIVMRAEWDVNRHLAQGLLEPVLPQYQTPAADVYAVYPQRHQFSTRVQTFVTFLAQALARSGALAGVAPDAGPQAGRRTAKVS
jgi:LysR family transcriptional regulator, transcriptional activator for dmlA